MANNILISAKSILDEIPEELLTQAEADNYKALLDCIPIGRSEIDDLRENQIELMESVANLLFVVRHRVSKVRSDYAPVKAMVIEEYTKNSKHKLTNEAREQLVSGDARCSVYAETLDIGSLLIEQITDIRKTLDQRYSMIFEKSIETRHDRKL